jgi:hypothetical protein
MPIMAEMSTLESISLSFAARVALLLHTGQGMHTQQDSVHELKKHWNAVAIGTNALRGLDPHTDDDKHC